MTDLKRVNIHYFSAKDQNIILSHCPKYVIKTPSSILADVSEETFEALKLLNLMITTIIKPDVTQFSDPIDQCNFKDDNNHYFVIGTYGPLFAPWKKELSARNIKISSRLYGNVYKVLSKFDDIKTLEELDFVVGVGVYKEYVKAFIEEDDGKYK